MPFITEERKSGHFPLKIRTDFKKPVVQKVLLYEPGSYPGIHSRVLKFLLVKVRIDESYTSTLSIFILSKHKEK